MKHAVGTLTAFKKITFLGERIRGFAFETCDQIYKVSELKKFTILKHLNKVVEPPSASF